MELDAEIAGQVAKYYADPLGFVYFAYPWGEKGGALQDYVGPDKWQADALREIGDQVKERKFDGIHAVAPIRYGISSGHGIGKTTLVAWVVDWIMSTRPDCKGTITANTAVQLETKTRSAIRYWTDLSVTSHWFNVTSDKMVRKGAESSWFCKATTCREENSEAFAGQHAVRRRAPPGNRRSPEGQYPATTDSRAIRGNQ